MDIDAMAIEMRKLKAFREQYEPILKELAEAKARHGQAQADVKTPRKFKAEGTVETEKADEPAK